MDCRRGAGRGAGAVVDLARAGGLDLDPRRRSTRRRRDWTAWFVVCSTNRTGLTPGGSTP